MRIRAGAQWQTGSGHRSFEVEMEADDVKEAAHDRWPTSKAARICGLQAELLVVQHVFSVGGLSAETARAKIQDLSSQLRKLEQ